MALTITLPDHIQSYIDQQIADGRFESETAVIVDRGEVIPWTDDLLDRLSEQARENSRRGHKVSDDITY